MSPHPLSEPYQAADTAIAIITETRRFVRALDQFRYDDWSALSASTRRTVMSSLDAALRAVGAAVDALPKRHLS